MELNRTSRALTPFDQTPVNLDLWVGVKAGTVNITGS